MKKIIFLLSVISCLFSYEIYKEIKIDNVNPLLVNRLVYLNIELDHVHIQSDNSIQFAVSESDLNKIKSNLIKYEVIHEYLDKFY